MADIEDSVRGSSIVIEDGVSIDSFVKIKPAGGDGDVVIGRDTTINSGVVIYTGNGVRIGANVAIAANTTIARTFVGEMPRDAASSSPTASTSRARRYLRMTMHVTTKYGASNATSSQPDVARRPRIQL